MTAVPFDTLKLARKLREAGFSTDQAEKTSEALGEAMDGADIATKSDLRALELRMTIKFGTMQAAAIAILLAALKYRGH